jgi:hypothetical protein
VTDHDRPTPPTAEAFDVLGPAQDQDGNYLDPDSGQPADYPIPYPASGPWTSDDLRRFRDQHQTAEPLFDPVQDIDAARADEADRLARAADDARQREQRDLVDSTPANVDRDGAAHFVVLTEDAPKCGTDGKPWPCPWAAENMAPAPPTPGDAP